MSNGLSYFSPAYTMVTGHIPLVRLDNLLYAKKAVLHLQDKVTKLKQNQSRFLDGKWIRRVVLFHVVSSFESLKPTETNVIGMVESTHW